MKRFKSQIKSLYKYIFLFMLIFAALNLVSCKEPNITFTAEVEKVSQGSMLVNTSDNVGFDKASVGYGKNLKLDFTPTVGQTVRITILPEVRESYPVQVTAVKIVLVVDSNTSTTSGDTKKGEEGNTNSTDPKPGKAEYKKITAEQAYEMMKDNDIIILDVREQDEFNGGHIENAVLLPYTEIAKGAESKLPDKDAVILVYCRSGRRSEIAARELVEMGYTTVYDFGGINDWPYDIVK